MKAHFYY